MTKFYEKTNGFFRFSLKILPGIFSLMSYMFLEGKIQAQTYCATSVGTNGNIYYVDSIRTTGGITDIVHLNNSPVVVNSNGYTDLTSQVVSGLQGSSFQLFLYGRQLYEYHWNVFIDWNQNGVLDDPGELVYSYLTGTQIRATSVTVNIPLTAVPGNTRMRVGMYRISTTSDPCYVGTGVMGYITDFTVNVVPLTPCTNPIVGGAATVSPAGQICPGSSALLSLSGITLSGNQTYEWESSLDNITYTSMGPAVTNPSTTVTPLVTTWYRCRVVCSGGAPAYSTPVQVNVSTGLSGVYTVDAATPTGGTNFNSFSDLTNALSCGVTGPVTVNVITGSAPYNEYLYFSAIPGASSVNTIRINGNGAQVEYATTSSERQLLTLAGTKYLRIDNLNFKTTTTTNFAWGALLMQGAEYDSITNCSFDLSAVSSTASANSNGIVFSNSVTSATGAGVNGTNCYIAGNHLIGPAGAAGMYYGIAIASGGSHNNTLLDNEIENYYSTGIYLNGAQNTLIEGNRLHNSTKTATFTTNYGIYTVSSDISGTRILKNRIYSPAGTGSSTSLFRGLYLLGDGSSGSSVLVANNLIYDINQGGATSGIYLDGALYNKVYHNTVSFGSVMTGTSANYGIYATGTNTGLEIKNNIVSITEGSGGVKYGFYYSSAASVDDAQRNNFYVNSNQSGTQNYGYYTTAYGTLSAFQAAYPALEVGSYDINPMFANVGLGDFTPTATALFLNGTNVLSDVPEDINGLPRTTTPTVGAFQRGASGIDNAGVNDLVELNAAFCSGTQDVNVIIANNGTNIINGLTVEWEVNGVAQTPYTYTGTLGIIGSVQGHVDTVTIGQYNFPAGTPTSLKIWTSNPNGNVDVENLDDTLSVLVQPSSFSVDVVSDTLCIGDSVVVSLVSSVNDIQYLGIQWESSLDGVIFNSVGVNGSSYTALGLTADEWYRTELSVNGNACYSDTLVVRVIDPQVVSVTNDTICGAGTATLSVTGSTGSNFRWYVNSVGGTPVGTGPSFTTPLLTATDTFYVAANSGGVSVSVGIPNIISTSGNTGLNIGIIFDAMTNLRVESIAVYPYGTASTLGAGTATFELRDANNVVLDTYVANFITTTTTPTVKEVVPVNFDVPAGNGYRIVWTAKSGGVNGLGRESTASNFSFPYTVPGLISLTNSTTSGYYYYLYDWKVASGCESPREMAIAVVTPPPTISASATQGTICKGSTTDLNVTSSHPGYTYEWQPINQSGASITVSPDTTTAYVVWAEDLTTSPFAGCIAVDTVLVTVDSILTPIVLTTPDTLCGGDTTHVSVNMPITKDFGVGASTGTTSSVFNPFYHTWGGTKSQYLILASELSAAGILPGTVINSLSVEFTSATGYAFNGFAVSMAHTTLNALTTALVTTGLTQVFSAASIQPFVGINTIPFTNNFVWDGVSNIIVQTCWSNNNTGSSTNAPLIKYDNTSFVSTAVYRVDNQTPAFVCGAATGSTTSSSRPWFRLGLYEQSSNYNYQWAGIGSTSSSFVDVPTNYTNSPVQKIYSVTVTGANNCTAMAADTIIVNPQPTASILSSSTVICSNDNTGFFIDASGSTNANSYLWLTDNSTAPSYQVTSAGTYILEVENTQGCRDWDTLIITSVTPVAPVISINYQGSQAVLDAGAGYTSYLWNTLATTQTIVVTNSGQYSVTVVDTNGCEVSSAPVNLSVSVKEMEHVHLNLFPNPNKGIFTLSIGNYQDQDLRIDMYDLSGRIVYNHLVKEVQQEMQLSFDVSTLSDGMYMLKLSSGNSSKTLRFTVVK